ncbi:MAG TPA: hypothetical protein PKV01_09595 [Anaerolineales bacterium]|nr:hypothetical protein [Anaerolineales bacterium]
MTEGLGAAGAAEPIGMLRGGVLAGAGGGALRLRDLGELRGHRQGGGSEGRVRLGGWGGLGQVTGQGGHDQDREGQ